MGYSSFHLYNVEWTTRWNWIRVESWTDTCTPAIKTSAKVICERLGDRRSPKIIRVVRALTRTRSLRNCEIVVRNIAATIYHEILSWILHDRNSNCTFQTLGDKISERFRRAEGAINRFVLWPPPDFRSPFLQWKTNFPPSKNSRERSRKNFDIFSPCHSHPL